MHAFRIVFIAVMALDFLVPLAVAIPYVDYSHRQSALSELGSDKSPLAFIYNGWTILSGAMFVWAGFVMRVSFAQSGLATALLVLLALYGIGCEIVSGLFPVRAGKADGSVSTLVHGAGSVIGFLAMLFAPLVLGILWLRAGASGQGIFSLCSFALAMASFVLFVMADRPRHQGTPIGEMGLWQRVALGCMYLPFCLWALGL